MLTNEFLYCVRDFWGRIAIFWVFVWGGVGADSAYDLTLNEKIPHLYIHHKIHNILYVEA